MNKLSFLKKFQIRRKNFPVKTKNLLVVGGVVLLVFIVAVAIVRITVLSKTVTTWEQQTRDFYDPIDVVLYNPEIQLIDIRQAEAFKNGHIKGAVNIPVDFEGGSINDNEKVIKQFAEMNTDLPIVIYGENSFTLRTIKVAQMLEEENISVKVLRVGWTEFFHFQTFWLPDEISSKVNIRNYIELPE